MHFSRKELYELVWSKPMTKLAEEFGLSDVGLAKICRRNNIPVPSRGYWARKQAGYKVKVVPLPPQKEEPLICIFGQVRNDKVQIPKELETVQKAIQKALVVPKTLRCPHPLVAKTVAALSSWKPDRDGLLPIDKTKALLPPAGKRIGKTARRRLRMTALVSLRG